MQKKERHPKTESVRKEGSIALSLLGNYNMGLLSSQPDSPGRGKPAAPYCSVIEEGTHPLSSTQYPVNFYGSPMTKDRAVTDGGQPGNGSGGQKCRGRSPEYHPHWSPWAKLDQTQLPIFPWNLDLPPTGNSTKGLTANGSPATQLDL